MHWKINIRKYRILQLVNGLTSFQKFNDISNNWSDPLTLKPIASCRLWWPNIGQNAIFLDTPQFFQKTKKIQTIYKFCSIEIRWPIISSPNGRKLKRKKKSLKQSAIWSNSNKRIDRPSELRIHSMQSKLQKINSCLPSFVEPSSAWSDLETRPK